MADPKPLDGWLVDIFHFFVFALHPSPEATVATGTPFALFTMTPGEKDPVSAIVITPDIAGQHAELVDLRQPGHVSSVSLSGK